MYANIPHCPDFSDLNASDPIMDIDVSFSPPSAMRRADGTREVEEWGLKVQRLANVFSVSLLFVSSPAPFLKGLV